jgi:L-threonylcarbamoyladenylate synthase
MLAPGRLASHYAPRAALRLDVTEVRPGEALLAFGPVRPAGAGQAVAANNLSETGDPHQPAAGLYEALRALDASGCATIAVAPIPGDGIASAIRDRLARAAAP